MMKTKRKVYVALLLLFGLLMAACAGPSETTNSNTSSGSPVAQSGTVAATSEAGSPSPQPAATTPESPKTEPKVEGGRAAVPEVTATPAIPAQSLGPAPRLVVPAGKINFGKQPQSKTLNRTITVRNAGKAALQIAAVEPS